MLFLLALQNDGLYYREDEGRLVEVESITIKTKSGSSHVINMADYTFFFDKFTEPSHLRSVVFMNDVEVWVNPFDVSYLTVKEG